MNLTDRLIAADDAVSRQVDGEIVLLDLVSGTYFGLDRVGARMWQLVEAEQGTLADVCDILGQEYEVSRDVLERDVLALAQQLIDQGLATERT